jgi:hypothetical protein
MKGYSSYRDEKNKGFRLLSRGILQAGGVYVKKTGSNPNESGNLIS